MANFGAAVSLKGYDVKTCADRFLVYSSAFRTLKILSTYYVSAATPKNNTGSVTSINTSTDTFTSASHGLENGELINFTADSAPGGIQTWSDEGLGAYYRGQYYYVINKTTNTFQVSLTAGGSAVNVTSTGTNVDWYSDSTKIVINHNLGYLSPWIIAWNGSDVAGVDESVFMSYGLNPMYIRIADNSTEIYITADFANPSETFYFSCYQFIDDFTDYTAPIISTDTTSFSTSQDYGFRISKPGFDVKECDDVDCILSSSFFTSVVQVKGSEPGSVDPITIEHGLGYIPSFLAYRKVSGHSFMEQSQEYFSVTDNDLLSYPDVGDTIYFVIFKNKNV